MSLLIYQNHPFKKPDFTPWMYNIRCYCIYIYCPLNLFVFFLYVCVQVMAEVSVLLEGPHDVGHRCHLFLNPNKEHDYWSFRLRTIKKTWPIHNHFLAHLDAYGLQGFARLTSCDDQVRSDPSLLTSLVDRWRPETHTLHFRFGELAPTLKDVSMITALPIRGEPVVSPRVSPSWTLIY